MTAESKSKARGDAPPGSQSGELLADDELSGSTSHATRLVGLAAELSGESITSVQSLASLLLALPEAVSLPEKQRSVSSALNGDGIPIELTISSRPGGLKYRLVTDPACVMTHPEDRLREARTALATLLPLIRCESLRPSFSLAIEEMLHPESADLSVYRNGPCCLAATLGEPSAALYIDAQSTGQEAWRNLESWLDAALNKSCRAIDIIRRIRGKVKLTAVGVEGKSGETALAKIYWRPSERLDLTKIGASPFLEPQMREFLCLAVRTNDVPPAGIMFGLGFRMSDGHLHDAKINVCGHCLAYPPSLWSQVVEDCSDCFGVAPIPVARALARPGFDISFITAGIAVDGSKRINCYVRPTASSR